MDVVGVGVWRIFIFCLVVVGFRKEVGVFVVRFWDNGSRVF